MNSKTLSSAGHRKRLRERFLRGGLEGFHDYEIVELLLTLSTPRKDCKEAAKLAIKTFGSLRKVLEASPEELQTIPGIGPNNILALKLVQAVARRALAERISHTEFARSSAEVLEYLKYNLRDRQREVFMALFLNGRNQILRMEELFVGTLTSSVVYPREVVKMALRYEAAAMVFVHNHPSGNPKPSREDIQITKRLKEALATVDITVHDHLIVAGQDVYSFADHGLI